MKPSKKQSWKRVLASMRLNLIACLVLVILGLVFFQLLRTELLKNAKNLGTSLAQTYASEERNNLTVYETLISFGTENISKRIQSGEGEEEIEAWMQRYFLTLQAVLGEEKVDPYIVLKEKIVAANPWEYDENYDATETEWYRKAMEADGDVIFTNVYTDAVYNKPVITVAKKCSDIDGVMAFDIFPENFQFQQNSVDLPEQASFFLCDGAGTLIYKEMDRKGTQEEVQAYVTQLLQKIGNNNQSEYDATITDMDGHQRVVYYSYMPNGWVSIVTMPVSVILSDLHTFTVVFFSLFLLWLVAMGIMTLKEWNLTRRVERTNDTVRVLGNSYYALYRIDYEDETYEMIKGSDYVRSRMPAFGSYPQLLKTVEEIIKGDVYQEFCKSFSVDNIRRLVAPKERQFGGDFQRKFGEEYRWVNVRLLLDESLAPGEIDLCFREVEREKQRQLQERRPLEDALESSRQSGKAKEAFFSNMSHDMRTPLNAIIGLSELAEKSVGEPNKVKDYLGKIHYSSTQLLNLINDILDMSRMEQGEIALSYQHFKLKDCLDKCLMNFKIQAEREKKEFRFDFDAGTALVTGDPFRIGQIMNNLLSNAFKFTSEGDTISVKVTQFPGQDIVKYKIVLEDTGIGMDASFLPRLFEPYARENRFTVKQVSGTGLGMSIVKSLIDQMNGQIYVESQPGEGTAFTLIIPFAVVRDDTDEIVQEPLQSEEKAENLEGKTVLLAEDNEINMEIAAEMLSMNGIRVVQAWNGKEALEAFQSSSLFSIDAVLMDMQMPIMDGCEAARRIRALKRPDAVEIPIIAVTANAFAEDIAATTAAGMNAHVSKPLDFTVLMQVLSDLIKV